MAILKAMMIVYVKVRKKVSINLSWQGRSRCVYMESHTHTFILKVKLRFACFSIGGERK